MSEYLIINAAILIVPLILSFESNLKFYRNLPAYLISVLIVSSFFILWDYIAVIRGDWSFNAGYVSGFSLLSLPVEEVLFFLTVPYSCLFIWETVNFYIADNKIKIPGLLFTAVGAVLIIIGILFNNQYYTSTVLIISGLVFLYGGTVKNDLLFRKNYWITLAVTYIPFFIINYILTSLPIVEYNSGAIWNIRIGTIPLEDAFYSFSMISLWIYFYEKGKIKFLT